MLLLVIIVVIMLIYTVLIIIIKVVVILVVIHTRVSTAYRTVLIIFLISVNVNRWSVEVVILLVVCGVRR